MNRFSALLLTLLLLPMTAFGATYTLPAVNTTSGPFAGCGVYGNVVVCNSGDLAFGTNDELVLTQNVTLQVGSSFSAGNNFVVNQSGSFSFLVQIGGNLSIGNNAQINGNFTAGANIEFGNNTDYTGDVTAGANLNFGNGSGVFGNCSGTNPGDYSPYCGVGTPVPTGGLCEQFESGFPSNWTKTVSGNAGVNTDTSSSGTSSLYLRSTAVIVTTNTYNIANNSSVDVTAWVRRGSNSISNYPETGEDLEVEYLDSAGIWHLVTTYLGGGTAGQSYNFSASFSGSQLHTKFALRFNKIDGNNGDYDYWHIDDVCITPIITIPTPVLEYRFDEANWNGTANEVLDSSPSAAHGTADAASGTTTSNDGAICNAASFNGLDQFIQSPGLSPLRTTSTLSFWIKTPPGYVGTSTPWNSPVVSGYEQSGGRDDIFWGAIDANGHISMSKGNTRIASSATSSAINDNTYHHVAMSWDSANGDANIYVDVFLDHNYTTETGDVTYLFKWIGLVEDSSGSLVFLEGLIDEFTIFDKVLNATEIAEIYSLQSNGQNLDGTARTCTPPKPSVCFSDDYQRALLGSDWAVSNRNGTFGDPRIVGNRLRITDNSGNVSTAATLFRLFPSAGNKIVVEFDYYAYDGGANGGDGLALVFSDANIVPQPGGYGGSLGYAQKGGISGFEGGWMAVGFDEYGNFLNQTDGNKSGGFTAPRRETITIRGSGSGTSGYNYITSNGQVPGSGITPSSLSPTVQTTIGHRYRVTIDHENGTNAFVTVERDSGSGFVDIIATFDLLAQVGQAAIPQKMYLTLTGSTGGAVNQHEIDNLEVCANTIEPAYYIDHYELDRDYNQGLTCEALNITSRACLNADCSVEISDPVTTTFSPATGWAGTNVKTNYTSSDSFTFQRTTVGTYTLGVTDSLPALKPLTTNTVQCFVAGTSQSNCNVDFVDAGYRFFNPALSASSVASYAMTAGQLLNGLVIRAIKTDETTGQCQAFLSNGSTVNSQVGTTCSNPNTCALGQQVTWQQTAASTIANPENQIAGNSTSTVGIEFITNGSAQFGLSAPDIGAQVLTVTTPNFPDINGSPSGRSISGSVILNVSPASLAITNVSNAASASNNGTSKFAKAGETFKTTLQARDINGNAVASFGRVTGLHNVNWNSSTLQAPVGGVLGTITGDSVGASSAAQWQGVDSDSNGSLDTLAFAGTNGIQYSEVGNVNLVASITNFMGFGTNILSTAVNVGRFTPAYLQVTEVTPDTAVWGSSSAVYQGQSNQITGVSYDVVAFDANNQPLKNYVGGYVDFANKLNALDKPTTHVTTGGTLNSDLTWTVSNDADFDGTIRLSAALTNVDWTRNSSSPGTADTLQNITDLLLTQSAFTDRDGICVQANAAGSCISTALDIADRSLYYARLRLPQQVTATSNIAYVPVTLEYLSAIDGSGEPIFSTQISENFFDATILSGLEYNGDLCSIASCPVTGASLTPVTLYGANGVGSVLSAGQGLLKYEPATLLQGILTADAIIPNWLTWYWDGDTNGNGSLDVAELNASGSMLLFGEYQGQAPLLFVRPGFR